MYVLMIALQGADLAMSATEGGDPSDCGYGRGNGGNVRDFILDGRLADIGVVMLAQFSTGGVDNQMNLPILDPIHDMRAPLVHF